jgi:capsular exopolysaccharide synthesis family protein
LNKTNKNNSNSANSEKSLLEIIHIIYRRKWFIIISVSVALLIATILSLQAIPFYEAVVILKKEEAPKNDLNSDFMEIVKMQNEDEVETEIELVKTVEVMSKVTRKLKLYLNYDKMVSAEGKSTILGKSAIEYSNPKMNLNQLPFSLPQFISIDIKDFDGSAKFYIVKENIDRIKLYDAATDQKIADIKELNEDSSKSGYREDYSTKKESANRSRYYYCNTSLASFKINWPAEVPVGSKFYFNMNSFNGTLDWVSKSIAVGKTGKTSLFSIAVQSNSPFMAKEIANSTVEEYRESRMEQKKQTIRYSFAFVDEQLQDMQLKLRESEDNLSTFKSNSQITTIDASSTEVVKFLSTLEAEQMNTELKLNEYKNKLEDMKKQMQTSGYFDQNFLTSEGSGTYGDPFASLLGQISTLELQKLELLQKRTENHPDVISLDRQINLAKEKLSSYNENTITAYQILISTLEKKSLDISNIMSKYEVKLEQLPGQENRFARLLREKSVYEKMFTMLLDKREEMRLAELSKLQDIVVIDPATEPIIPKGPKKLFNFLIALVLGSLAGVLGIFFVELKNSKLVNLDELESDFRLTVLSIIPKYPRALKQKIETANDPKEKFISLIDEESGFKETYSLLRTKLELQLLDKRKIFMITSCEENSGKSSIVSNLAISFSQNSKRVLVIDCDLRKAGLSRYFDVLNEKDGLIEYLSKGTTPILRTQVSKLIDILPTGGLTLDSSNLLNSERMEKLLSLFDLSVYDYIIIDTPPVTKVVDALIIGKYVRDAILVVRPDLSLKENVRGGLNDLSEARIKVRGIIVNAAEITKSYYYKNRYGYGYGYGYGKSSSEENGKSLNGLKRKMSQIKEKTKIKSVS